MTEDFLVRFRLSHDQWPASIVGTLVCPEAGWPRKTVLVEGEQPRANSCWVCSLVRDTAPRQVKGAYIVRLVREFSAHQVADEVRRREDGVAVALALLEQRLRQGWAPARRERVVVPESGSQDEWRLCIEGAAIVTISHPWMTQPRSMIHPGLWKLGDLTIVEKAAYLCHLLGAPAAHCEERHVRVNWLGFFLLLDPTDLSPSLDLNDRGARLIYTIGDHTMHLWVAEVCRQRCARRWSALPAEWAAEVERHLRAVSPPQRWMGQAAQVALDKAEQHLDGLESGRPSCTAQGAAILLDNAESLVRGRYDVEVPYWQAVVTPCEVIGWRDAHLTVRALRQRLEHIIAMGASRMASVEST